MAGRSRRSRSDGSRIRGSRVLGSRFAVLGSEVPGVERERQQVLEMVPAFFVDEVREKDLEVARAHAPSRGGFTRQPVNLAVLEALTNV